MSDSAGPLRGATVLYGILLAGAFAWVLVDRGTSDLYRHPDPLWRPTLALGLLAGLALGIALGLLVVALTRRAVRRFRWAVELHSEFRSLLGPATDGDIFLLAAFSALAEECFFRGAMQPTAGLVVSSLVFGGLHLPMSKRFLVWTLEATAMGFVLGLLFWATGQLAAPIAAHFTINYENLHFVRRYKPA